MLGPRIASLRQNAGLSQAELAHRLHISPSAIGMYEQGRREPSVAILIALSQEFRVSLDYLLSGKPDTLRDISALHGLVDHALQEAPAQMQTLSKEEIVCHLLWALLG